MDNLYYLLTIIPEISVIYFSSWLLGCGEKRQHRLLPLLHLGNCAREAICHHADTCMCMFKRQSVHACRLSIKKWSCLEVWKIHIIAALFIFLLLSVSNYVPGANAWISWRLATGTDKFENPGFRNADYSLFWLNCFSLLEESNIIMIKVLVDLNFMSRIFTHLQWKSLTKLAKQQCNGCLTNTVLLTIMQKELQWSW